MKCVTHLREIIGLRLHVLFKSTGVTTVVKQVSTILYLHACPEIVIDMVTCALLSVTLVLHPNLKIAAVVIPQPAVGPSRCLWVEITP